MHAAVFVDFENLFLSLKNREELSGLRIRELSLGILEQLKERLQKDKAPMVLGRSYAAFDTYPGMEVAHDLALMGFDPQYVLVGHAGKNSADVQLACDVCRVLYRRPDIDAIVIVSGDRDFIPIARQVLEENRELRVVAIPDSTSGDLRMRVGGERFWNALDLIDRDKRETEPVAPAPSEVAVAAVEPPSADAQADYDARFDRSMDAAINAARDVNREQAAGLQALNLSNLARQQRPATFLPPAETPAGIATVEPNQTTGVQRIYDLLAEYIKGTQVQPYGYAEGGLASVAPKGMYLGGSTDGMADQIPATIDNRQPAALSDGEFVIPADVVSHLGNGNSDAGAKQLYGMMDRIRKARTGTTQQGKQINPNKFLA